MVSVLCNLFSSRDDNLYKCMGLNVFRCQADKSESEYSLSQYKFTRKFVLWCTVGNRINNRLILANLSYGAQQEIEQTTD